MFHTNSYKKNRAVMSSALQIFFIVIPILLNAQSGKILNNLTLKSDILKCERHFAIYLPHDYEISQRTYPVLYLLHGAGDNQNSWIQHGEVQFIADKAINSGEATPMIIVIPDADTGQRGYFNSPDGKWLYEDFFFKEFIPYVEKNYHINDKKRYRAVAGISMGGGGSFVYALRYPGMFSSSCPLSAFEPNDLNDLSTRLSKRGLNFTDQEIQEYYKNTSILGLIKTQSEDSLKSVRWYIDCGDDDDFSTVNSLIHIAMKNKKIPHEFRIRNGVHQWKYWRESLPEILKFITKTFRKDRDR